MLKVGQGHFLKFLTALFNRIFYSGAVPETWREAVIVPIHKKGDVNCASNYRGVSLLSVVGKCYTSVLNRRLYDWVEQNEIIDESQAGFRKGYSTTDHIFTLYAMTQKYLSKKGGKLYVAFVDLKRAFDSVQHNQLLISLQKNGISKQFISAIEALYSSVKASVKLQHGMTESFDCEQGLR